MVHFSLLKQLLLFFGIPFSIIPFLPGSVPLSIAFTSIVLLLSTVSLLLNFALKIQRASKGDLAQVETGFSLKRREELLVGNKTAHSGCESIDDLSFSCNDSEYDWNAAYDVHQSSTISDGSISDEESRIEIAFRSGRYLKPGGACGTGALQNLQEEMFTEISGEDNMIEIDIAKGIVKC